MKNDTRPDRRTDARRAALALAVLVVAAVVVATALRAGLLPADLLLERHRSLQALVDRAPWWSAIVYVGVYALVIALALPGGTVLSLGAGYLFGPLAGTVVALGGATLGALASLVVVRGLAGGWFRRRLGERFERIRALFLHAPVRNLLLLRLIPIFPFFAVNIGVALLGVRTWLFLWTTVLGVLPSTIAYAFIGAGLGEPLAQGRLPGPELLLEPAVLWPSLTLTGLVLLAGRLRREV
jgi:uncharacterized membrane protein YdjX (TVP38/TMEM64 family)